LFDRHTVTERAVPTAIFSAEPTVRRHYLRKWLRQPGADEFDIRDILDWSYYIERLAGAIQKIITIPAALQGCANPVPRVAHPDWLHKRILEKNDRMRQRKITDMFRPTVDVEDAAGVPRTPRTPATVTTLTRLRAPVHDEQQPSTSTAADPQQTTVNEQSPAVMRTWRARLGVAPLLYASPTAWLAYHKRKWCIQRDMRTTQARSERMARIGTMQVFARASAHSLMSRAWHVLQVRLNIDTMGSAHTRVFAVGRDEHARRIRSMGASARHQ
jgi:DNA polymerase epsilon subunit 1